MDSTTWFKKYGLPILGAAIVAVLLLFNFQQQDQIRKLQNQVATMENSTPVAPKQTNTNTNTPPSNPTTPDNRKLWTYNTEIPDDKRCEAKFNTDKPSTTVKYSNSEFGIEMMIPYNPKWGTDVYRIAAFEELGGSEAQFGPISGFEGCGWVRQFSMSTGPLESAAQVVKKVNDNKDEFTTSAAQQFTIGNLTAVRYEYGGLCDQAKLVIIGKKFNYYFHSLCAGQKDPGYAQLIEIAKTIKLID